MDYYSFFAKSVLLNGMIGKYEINFIITDVDKIDLSLNSSIQTFESELRALVDQAQFS